MKTEYCLSKKIFIRIIKSYWYTKHFLTLLQYLTIVYNDVNLNKKDLAYNCWLDTKYWKRYLKKLDIIWTSLVNINLKHLSQIVLKEVLICAFTVLDIYIIYKDAYLIDR